MKLPLEVVQKYGVHDGDVSLFVDHWDEPCPGKVLIAGAHDECTAHMLQEAGWDVTGVDLREYDKELPPANYRYVRGDFVTADVGGGYDAFVALSCLEHFGLGTYQEGPPHPYYDVIAMHKAWERLKVGGRAYLTVPFGRKHLDVVPHWRVYELGSLRDRLAPNFTAENLVLRQVDWTTVDGRRRDVTEQMTRDEILNYEGDPPHVSALLVLRKRALERLAPDGR